MTYVYYANRVWRVASVTDVWYGVGVGTRTGGIVSAVSDNLKKSREFISRWPILQDFNHHVDMPQFMYKRILKGDPCSFCGELVEVTIDHILPKSDGGQNVWDNYTAACFACNNAKASTSLLHFLLERT